MALGIKEDLFRHRLIGLERLIYVEVLAGWRRLIRAMEKQFHQVHKKPRYSFRYCIYSPKSHTHQSFSTLSSAGAHAAALWMLCVLICRYRPKD